MKNYFLVLLVVNFLQLFSQEKPKSKFYFEEFQANVNATVPYSLPHKVGYGLGLKMLHAGFPSSQSQLVFGGELNFTSFFSDYIKGDSRLDKNVHFTVFTFSLPLFYRYYFKETKRSFFQSGLFIDFNLAGGAADSTYYFGKSYQKPEVNSSVPLNTRPTFGVLIGFGRRFDLGKRTFYWSSDVKLSVLPLLKDSHASQPIFNNYLRFGLGIVTK